MDDRDLESLDEMVSESADPTVGEIEEILEQLSALHEKLLVLSEKTGDGLIFAAADDIGYAISNLELVDDLPF